MKSMIGRHLCAGTIESTGHCSVLHNVVLYFQNVVKNKIKSLRGKENQTMFTQLIIWVIRLNSTEFYFKLLSSNTTRAHHTKTHAAPSLCFLFIRALSAGSCCKSSRPQKKTQKK